MQISLALTFVALLALSLGYAQTDQPETADGDPPTIMHVCTVAPDVLALQIQERSVEWGEQEAYERREGDRVDNPEHHRWVFRGDQCLGALAGTGGDLIRTLDRHQPLWRQLMGPPFDALVALEGVGPGGPDTTLDPLGALRLAAERFEAGG